MSYAQALDRIGSIQSRMSTLQVATLGGNGSAFSSHLATAVNHFDNGLTRINEPQDGTGGSVRLNEPDVDDSLDSARVRASSLGTSSGVSAAGAASAYAGATSSITTATTGLTPALSATFDRLAAKYHVPAGLAKAVARAESGFRSDAVSGAGAQGLMQLMPSTAKGLGVTDSFDADQNAEGGVKYLQGLLSRFHGDASLALAGYNAGPNAVARYGGVPPYPETQQYVSRVLGYAKEFGWTPDAATTPPTGAPISTS